MSTLRPAAASELCTVLKVREALSRVLTPPAERSR